MTRLDFIYLCGKYFIDVDIAMENEELVKLLKNRASAEEIEKFIQENF